MTAATAPLASSQPLPLTGQPPSPPVASRRLSGPSRTSLAALAGRQISGRELEVMRLVADGLVDAEIAAALFLSLSTVKTHIRRVLAKLGERGRMDAVRVLRERGLLPDPARVLLVEARKVLLAVPACEEHESRAAGCAVCRRYADARRVQDGIAAFVGAAA